MSSPREIIDLFIYDKINVVEDKFPVIINVLDKYTNLLESVFVSTRNYNLGLRFYDLCQHIIEDNLDKITFEKFQAYEKFLISLKLDMLDCLDDWNKYGEFFNWALECVKIPVIYEKIEKRHEKYVYYDSSGPHIHFLYLHSYRYEIILKKLERQQCGKSTKNMRHRQQDELSPEDIEERIERCIKFFYVNIWPRREP